MSYWKILRSSLHASWVGSSHHTQHDIQQNKQERFEICLQYIQVKEQANDFEERRLFHFLMGEICRSGLWNVARRDTLSHWLKTNPRFIAKSHRKIRWDNAWSPDYGCRNNLGLSKQPHLLTMIKIHIKGLLTVMEVFVHGLITEMGSWATQQFNARGGILEKVQESFVRNMIRKCACWLWGLRLPRSCPFKARIKALISIPSSWLPCYAYNNVMREIPWEQKGQSQNSVNPVTLPWGYEALTWLLRPKWAYSC